MPHLHTVPGTQPCPTCTQMETTARDPRTPHPQAHLYALIIHRLDDHHDDPHPLPDCPECRYWTATGREAPRIAEHLLHRWASQHFMCHHLGIATYTGYGYRYIDAAPAGARRDARP
ncbi:hypothetical protein [Streptomyces sp. NPDC018045]|uniref:hypothetical protein n=1 Tax=Streptomyces sp. NPDC018045 TaxID=3365037 RepID=UPI0037AD719D